MQTLGFLIDQLSICKIREQSVSEKIILSTNNKKKEFEKISKNNKDQIEFLKQEIDKWIYDAISGRTKNLSVPKNKLYYNSVDNIEKKNSIANNVCCLFEANQTLWNLEDVRRIKTLSDEIRLKACDNISAWNQKRNMYIDEIDRLFSSMVKNNKRPL